MKPQSKETLITWLNYFRMRQTTAPNYPALSALRNVKHMPFNSISTAQGLKKFRRKSLNVLPLLLIELVSKCCMCIRILKKGSLHCWWNAKSKTTHMGQKQSKIVRNGDYGTFKGNVHDIAVTNTFPLIVFKF